MLERGRRRRRRKKKALTGPNFPPQVFSPTENKKKKQNKFLVQKTVPELPRSLTFFGLFDFQSGM
jgi:hypothetical protein